MVEIIISDDEDDVSKSLNSNNNDKKNNEFNSKSLIIEHNQEQDAKNYRKYKEWSEDETLSLSKQNANIENYNLKHLN